MSLPREIIAIFHASFHPTKGNIIDWSLKADDALVLDGIEFSVLPSGLHLVEKDVVYFFHHQYSGLALFRRRPTLSEGHRGFRLTSLGILLAESPRPKPWLYLSSLQNLAERIYFSSDTNAIAGSSTSTAQLIDIDPGDSQIHDKDLEPVRDWFEQYKTQKESLTGQSSWTGWNSEFSSSNLSIHTPTPHLPHLLRILGPAALTLYKFILARRRVLIFTLPPVEVACILAWISADLCREYHMSSKGQNFGIKMESLFGDTPEGINSESRNGPRVLGMVTLSNLDQLERESEKGDGWIACTTDAIFLEKPSYYDLIIDLTTSTPSKSSRPTFYMSKEIQPPSHGKRKATWKLESVRYTWSDLKTWSEIDRILKLHDHTPHRKFSLPVDSTHPLSPRSAMSKWSDMFQVYEDVCLLCATLWLGLGTWRSNSHESFTSVTPGKPGQWGAVSLEGDEDWSLNGTHMRNLGSGIEGRPRQSMSSEQDTEPNKRDSNTITTAPKAIHRLSSSTSKRTYEHSEQTIVEEAEEDEDKFQQENVRTTLALLQTFHAHTVFLLSRLHDIMPPPSASNTPIATVRRTKKLLSTQNQPRGDEGIANDDIDIDTITVSARDLLSMELGVISDLDAKFIEWLAQAEGYVGPAVGRRLEVKRGWKEFLGVVLGFG